MKSETIDCIRNTIMCGICLNVMRQPLSLPCTHTFCDECASKVVEETTKCPLCSYGSQKNETLSLTSSNQLSKAIRAFEEILHLVDPSSAPVIITPTKQSPAIKTLPRFAIGDLVEVAPRSWPGSAFVKHFLF